MSDATNPLPRKLVVAGLILAEGRVLLSQRGPNQSMSGFWELPGGKIELGESPTLALARELEEEIGVQVRVGRIWEVLHHVYQEFELVMLVYLCALEDGEEPRCVEVAEFAWVSPQTVRDYDLLPADIPLAVRLEREGAPEF